MALSGSGNLAKFLDLNYSGSGPDFSWKYSWSYDPAADSLSVTFTLQGYCTSTGVTFGMRYRVTNTPWVTFSCNNTQFQTYTAAKTASHTVSGWQDIFSFTKEITGTGGQAEISIKNYGQAIWGTSTAISTCDITQTLSISADRGIVWIDNGSEFVAAIPYIDDGSAWHQAIPYVDNGSTFDLIS